MNLKIRTIKAVDALIGAVAVAALPAARTRASDAPRRFLVIRPGGIGDAILLAPALKALRAACPGCAIDVLAEKRNAAAFGLIQGIDRVHRYDSRGGLVSVLRGRYDAVIDTEQWYRLSAVVARLTGAAMLVGFATNERRRLQTHPVAYDMASYEAHSFFQLLEPLGIDGPTGIAAPFLEIPSSAAAQAETLLQSLSGRPFVAVFPGASTKEKQWGTDNFQEVVSRITGRGVAVVLVGGGDTRDLAAEIAAGGGILDLTGKTSLAVTAAVIGKGRALICGDSGLLHIAAGLGTPTVSLFGPSDPRKWAPVGEGHRHVTGKLSCAPCSRFGTTPPCPIGTRCISAITVEQVAAAAGAVLEGGKGE